MHQIDRRSGLGYREFVEEYLIPRKPVVITDGIGHWRAAKEWSLDFFSQKFGTKMVRCRGQAHDVALGDYIANLAHSTLANPSPYLRNISIQGNFPEVLSHILPRFHYATPDLASSYLLPYGFPRKRYTNHLFISGRGSRIILHYDDWMFHAVISNIQGVKRFTLFPPSDAGYLYPREDDIILSQIPDFYNLDGSRFPLVEKATRHEVDVGPLESIFVPCGWWHTTLTLESCISVGSAFVSRWNWNAFAGEMTRIARHKKKRPLLAGMIHSYLFLVGKTLGSTFPQTGSSQDTQQ